MQLLDGGIRCDSNRAEDVQSAVSAVSAEWDEDLVEDRILSNASTFHGARLKVGEPGIVLPANGRR
jgi:hypothetical protein